MEFFAWWSGVSLVVLMCLPIFNYIFALTWELFVATSAMIVKEAFRTTGLYPLDPVKAEEKPGASTMGALFSREANANLVENPDAESTEWVGELHWQQEAILITGTNVEESKGATICKAVLEYVMKQLSKQSAEYHKELQQLKA
eukprot:1050805-Rhodomonas_salina.1